MRRGKPSKILELLVIVAVVLAMRALGFADALATLEGSVVDGRAAAITGATVLVTCGKTTLFARVDASGHYRIGGLPAGTCSVTAAATRFAPRTQTVTLAAGSTTTLAITLAADKTPPPPAS